MILGKSTQSVKDNKKEYPPAHLPTPPRHNFQSYATTSLSMSG